MNNVFVFTRWVALIRSYWFDQKKNFLFLFLAVAAGFFLWYGFHLMLRVRVVFELHNQIEFYFIGLFLTGCLSGSLVFSSLRNKPKAITWLLTPASVFEKLLCNLLFGVVGFFIGYTLVFFTVSGLMVGLANYAFTIELPIFSPLSLDLYEPMMGEETNSSYLYLYFEVQAVFILGSVYFRNNGLFKTIVGALLAWCCFILLVWSMGHLIPPGVGQNNHLVYEIFDESGDNKIITLPPVLHFLDMSYLKYGITIGLWIATYFRLKEKQVA